MPTASPNPPTVAGIGPATAEALLVLARRLDELSSARARLAAEVRFTWVGPARSRFDAERAVRDAAASALADRCRRVAGDLSGLAAA